MSRPQDSRLPYLPGIDALRAIAVLAVFGYHAGIGWMPGGFLGVDVFFVISGYLITSLLLSEYRRGGHVKLGRFWLRRARRLLPAVGMLIAVTMIVAAIVEPDRMTALRGDALASLGYVANWHFIYAHQSYFEQFQRPSLFRHLWSLSVEEQFYLFWPLAFAVGMSAFGRRRLLLGVIAGALASLALAWILFDPANASRVYYGTDTHAAGLLAGIALALVWSPADVRRGAPWRWTGPLLDALGVLALSYIVLSFVQVHDYDLALFHGGYFWLALATTALLAVLAHPAARLGGLLARPPLIWLGLRSYSFYLWHWPVLALTRPGIDVSLPRPVLIPAAARRRPRPCRSLLPLRRAAVPRQGEAAGAPRQLAAVRPTGAGGRGRRHRRSGRLERHRLHRQPPPGTRRGGSFDGSLRQGHGRLPRSQRLVAPRQQKTLRRRGGTRIVAFGDSVMIGAKERLAARFGPRFSMNAKEGRQASEFVDLAEGLKRHGASVDALIVQMGNNGPLYGDEMEALHEATANVGELFLVNDHAPVSWVDESNHALAEADEDWPHTTLIDWAAAAAGNESYFWDGIHLTPQGAGAYTRLIVHAVRARAYG